MEEDIKSRIAKIEARNARVETDKKWETSKTRIFSICIVTYIVAVGTLFVIGVEKVFVSALVPVFGFYLSTQSLPLIRKWWEKRNEKK